MQNRIRHWRRERGLSQEALGRLVGLAKPTISKLERGELRLRDVTISRLVEALGVSAGELLGDYALGGSEIPPDDGEAVETTHFGFGTVDMAEKARLVGGVFASVARNYDLMNDLMSGGVHRLWKADMIAALRPRPGIRLLDLAGGTGDIARRVMARIATVQSGAATTGGRIVVCDASEAMLGVGRDRALDDGIVAGIATGIDWLCGDAEDLPLADASMDACTIAFGIRNVTRVERALAEVRRVLKPGGRFLCLEFSHVRAPALAALYDAYSFRVLPTLGAVVAGDRDSYRYLVESIRRFPDQESFAAMIADAGLGQVSYRNLTGGIAALHSAWRI